MKRLITFLGTLLLFSLTFAPYVSATSSDVQLAGNESTDIDELLIYHQQLYEEYQLALENNDVDAQNYLIEEGERVLQQISDIDIEADLDLLSTGDTSYYDYFTTSYWITRSIGVSLSIYPINLAWPRGAVDIEYAWQHILKWHSSDSQWNNTTSMRGQFWCHANLAGSMKTPWNIEPWKTSFNPFTCN